MATPPDHGPPTDAPAPGAGGGEPSVWRRLGATSFLGVAALVMPPIGGMFILAYMDTIARLLNEQEWGMAIYAAAFAVLAGLALLPTYSQALLGGWAFSLWGGFGAALVGFVGGALIGYGVARPTAGSRVVAIIDEKPRWAAVRDALLPSAAPRGETAGGAFLRTLMIITLLRLPPNSPFAITNLVLASVRVPPVVYLLGTLLGMAPRTLAAVWIGHELQSQFSSFREGIDAPRPWWLIAAGIALVVVALGVIGVISRRALARVTGSHRAAPR